MRSPLPRAVPLLALLLLPATLTATLTATLAVPTATAAPDPVAPAGGVLLDGPVRGAQAVRLLGEDLAEAGRVNDLTGGELRTLLLQDRTAWVDSGARLFYADPAPTGPTTGPTTGEQAATARPAATTAAAYPLGQTFALHSKPGSQRTILLDFDGAVVSGTAWNDNGLPAGAQPAWTTDGDATTFNDAERTAIQSVWARVAEDYAPFDVDVTTQDPGDAAITRSGAGDAVFGTRVLVTPSSDAQAEVCNGVTCGGVAYLGVFDTTGDHAAYQPAWVFPQSLGNSAKNIAEAASHEAGHNFGLEHDGVTNATGATSGYYSGHGSWAPIMGAGYGKPVTQWSRGEYAGATSTQDDVALIASGGAPYRSDEAGSSVAGAPALPAGQAYVTARTDVDTWSLGVCAGDVTVAATPAATSPDLDIKLSLLDAGGAVLATSDPTVTSSSNDVATGLSASITRTLASGTYYVSVDGVGSGTAYTGYTDYASIGAYSLARSGPCGVTSVPAAPSAPRDLTVTPGADGTSAALTWSAPASAGDSAVTGYTLTRTGGAAMTLPASATGATWSGLTPSTSYGFTVAATSSVGTGAPATVDAVTAAAPVTDPTPTTPVTPANPDDPDDPTASAPRAPVVGTALAGRRGGPLTARATWSAPTGGAAVAGYRVRAVKVDARGRVLRSLTTPTLSAGARSVTLTLPRGRWRFAVAARNAAGWGAPSALSNAVRAR